MIKSNRIFAVLAIVASFAVAAGDPYKDFYEKSPWVPNGARALPGYVEFNGDPEIRTSADPASVDDEMARAGYVEIGRSIFNATTGEIYRRKLQKHMSRIGAHAAVVISQYSHTNAGTRTVITPNNSTTISQGSATAYGSGGSANAYGSSTSTTLGMSAQVVPTTESRSNVMVRFFARVKHSVGLYFVPLSDVQRQELQTNQGVVVAALVDGSPAYRANVLKGDLLLRIGDVPMFGKDDWDAAIAKYAGTSPEFEFMRAGEKFTKSIPVLAL